LRVPAAEMKSLTGPVRLVVFLTDKHSGRVLGVQEETISR
jgi:hypothetical protein